MLKCLITKYLIFLQVIRVFQFFNGGSMTNAKVYQGFHDDKRLKSTVLHQQNILTNKIFFGDRQKASLWAKRQYSQSRLVEL